MKKIIQLILLFFVCAQAFNVVADEMKNMDRMSAQLKQAIKAVAVKRGLTLRELSNLRKTFAGVEEVKPPKKFRTPSESGSRGGANPTSDEPSITINEPSVPEGKEAAKTAPSPPSRKTEKK